MAAAEMAVPDRRFGSSCSLTQDKKIPAKDPEILSATSRISSLLFPTHS
jgi:hypothetical protein